MKYSAHLSGNITLLSWKYSRNIVFEFEYHRIYVCTYKPFEFNDQRFQPTREALEPITTRDGQQVLGGFTERSSKDLGSREYRVVNKWRDGRGEGGEGEGKGKDLPEVHVASYRGGSKIAKRC